MHVWVNPGASLRDLRWGDPSKDHRGNPKAAVEKSTHATSDYVSEVKMVLFSRAFIRKRMICAGDHGVVCGDIVRLGRGSGEDGSRPWRYRSNMWRTGKNS